MKVLKMTGRILTSLILILSAVFVTQTSVADVVDTIVAVVNDEVITQGELNSLMLPVYTQLKASFEGEELLQELERMRKKVLDQLIENKLVLQEARKHDIRVNEETVEGKLTELKNTFASPQEFEVVLAEQNLTEEDLRQRYRDQLKAFKFVSREVRAKVFVSPKEVSEYYESHLEEFKTPEQVMASNILIRVAKGRARPKARAIAEKVHKLLINGADFGTLAKQYSQGPNARNGGDIGYIRQGQLLNSIDRVIFELKEGEISKIIETDLGFHIFKVSAKRKGGVQPLSEVRSVIESRIFQEKADKKYRGWISKLKKDAYISFK